MAKGIGEVRKSRHRKGQRLNIEIREEHRGHGEEGAMQDFTTEDAECTEIPKTKRR
jgi:hypothetical protein